MIKAPKRKSTQRKHKAAVEHFKLLFEKKRIRIDDSIQKTAEKFFYTEPYLEDVLRAHGVL